ncbi:hypothetical protein NPIL_648401 [Nephila pilipes]|uniref:Uncharacterized protein n=1 Tax=Nephila pilipes TaxID=299642 RepID=A0A8X6U1Q5_NEPPI|nr:hypothetical protein NPIL_648401 [Nephila pilipes]
MRFSSRSSRSSEELTLAVRAPDSVTSFGMFARFRQSACARITRQECKGGGKEVDDVKRQKIEQGGQGGVERKARFQKKCIRRHRCRSCHFWRDNPHRFLGIVCKKIHKLESWGRFPAFNLTLHT